jgi:hypothetical protein
LHALWITGDPVAGTCRLPPGLLLIFPSQHLALSTVKPRPATSPVVALLNRGTTAIKWYIASNGATPSLERYRHEWTPHTDNSSSGGRLIHGCSLDEVKITVPSTGVRASGNVSLGFTLFSNSITGNAPRTVSLEVSAAANATYSQLLLPTNASAGSSIEARILIYDSDGMPVEHAQGGEDVTVSVRHVLQPTFFASCSLPTLTSRGGAGQQAYYSCSCRLPRDARGRLLTGVFRVEAQIGGARVWGSPAGLPASCPGNLLPSTSGTCIYGPGTYSSPVSKQCLPCPPGTFKDSLVEDSCRLCADFTPGTNTTPGVVGARSVHRCVCKSGSYMRNR